MLGRTRAEKARVRLGNRKTEGVAELEDVPGVLACGLVPEVTEDLHGCRDAWNGCALDPPRNEAFGRVPKRPAPRLGLHPAALGVEADRVEVELLPVAPEHEPNRELVFVQHEAERPKRLVDSRNVAQRNDQIEVFVWPGLAPQQRIDTPASVERCLDPARTKEGQKLEDTVGGHSDLDWFIRFTRWMSR